VTVSWLRASALTLVVAPALAVLATVDPNEPGHYPTCPFKWATGLDCPGCGSLRALHSLTHGDVRGALDHNVLLVAVLPLLAAAAFRWVRREPSPRVFYTPSFAWGFAAISIGWMVVRNLPWFPVLGSS
jgi:hypothetical protein